MFWQKKNRGLTHENPIIANTVEEEYAYIRGTRCPKCQAVGTLKKEALGTDFRNKRWLSIHYNRCDKCGESLVLYFDCSNQEHMREVMSKADPDMLEKMDQAVRRMRGEG